MRDLLKPILLALLLMAPSLVHATAQSSDKIWIDGNGYDLDTNPLEHHLGKIGWKPPKDAVIWTSNWRGNIAEWKIEEGQLVLVDVTISVRLTNTGREEVRRSIREELFPAMPRVVADWYSGALIIPDGKMTEYVHMGYDSSYDHYQILRIDSGRVIEHLSLTGKEFERYKTRKFEEFSKTEQFRDALELMRKDSPDRDDEGLIEFMRSFYTERYLSM